MYYCFINLRSKHLIKGEDLSEAFMQKLKSSNSKNVFIEGKYLAEIVHSAENSPSVYEKHSTRSR